MDQKWKVAAAGLSKMQAVAAGPRQAALTMMGKLLSNVLKNPTEEKFQTIWLVNAKVSACLNAADGAVKVLEGAGFEPTANRDANLVYNDYGDKSNNHLYRVHDQVNSALYEIIGRPNEKGELGGQAHMGGPIRNQGIMGDPKDKQLAEQIAARGGVCATKFEASESAEMTIVQSQQIQVSRSSLVAN
jgi:hypothetical protein